MPGKIKKITPSQWERIKKIVSPAIILLALLYLLCCSGIPKEVKILTGAEQSEKYLAELSGKNVALVVNQTSMVNNMHLVDFLKENGIRIRVIFAPEHGFRGEAEAGAEIENGIDSKTGISIVSLYGKNKKPTDEQLAGIDRVIFDIQDVGCRFYTYISTLHYVMEACAANNKPLLILDRPNPNGDYIDGPVLDTALKSFVGMHPVPVVHGCTLGEFAQMINGENWLDSNKKCNLRVIPVAGYTHSTRYKLPVKPSPNLPNNKAIRLYPSLCFFEATNVSIGRGTPFPFQVIGYPDSSIGSFSFTPVSIKGVSEHPKHQGKTCYGTDLRNLSEIPQFTLKYFIEYFKKVGSPDLFWNSKQWIDLLSGDTLFYHQVNNGLTEAEIRKTWRTKLEAYKQIRKKYLLYPDYEQP
ncbi:MAG: DUF1343 domain-containing protein [Prolixibacteraceae bacterium]|nr:DUF1343 domain-containing protein [Prolixibacteraceae bacterium]